MIAGRFLRRMMRASSIVVLVLSSCVVLLAYFAISRQSQVSLEVVNANLPKEEVRHVRNAALRKSLAEDDHDLKLEQLVRHPIFNGDQIETDKRREAEKIQNLSDEVSKEGEDSKAVVQELIGKTFFDSLEFGFKNIELEPDGGIPTQDFIRASREMSKLMGHLGSSSLARSYVEANFKTLQKKYDKNPEESTTLQRILREELENGKSGFQVALVWTTRPLAFLYHFLLSIVENGVDTDTIKAATQSYALTLEPYHGMLTRMAAKTALKLTPDCKSFLKGLCVDEKDRQNPDYFDLIIDAIDKNIEPMGKILSIVKEFYENNGLDF